MRKSVIQFFNWWDTPSSSEKKFFESFIGKCADSYDEVHIHAAEYSPGNETNGIKMPTYPMSDKILRIQYSGEPSYGHLDKFNINIVPGEHPDTPEYIVNPHMHLFIARYGCPMSTFTEKRKYGGSKEKFCIFTVSNPTANERIRCFNELSKYKKVDSCGKVLNNMSFNCPGNVFSREYIAHTSKYKFNICFENKSMKHYLTEKLAVAYMSGSIPIYWGCSNLSDYINMDAIVYLKPNFTDKDLAALIDEVKALDNDETLYKKKFEQPMFKDGLVPAAFDMNELNKKVCKYIESKTQSPLRGGSKTNRISFITYGNDAFKQSKERIVNEAKDTGCFNGQIKAYGPDDLSKEFLEKVASVISMPRGGGYWIWKPYVIYDMLNQLNDNDILVYADSGCTLQKSAINRFNEYINMISPETPYCVLGMRLRAHNRDGSLKNISLKQKIWTTNKIFEYFHINSDSDIANKEQIHATVIICRKSPESLAIFKKWLNVAEEKPDLFTDEYNSESKRKNPHFSDNRHDQSIYSIILQIPPYNKSAKIINDETFDLKPEDMFIRATRIRQGGGSRRIKRKYNRICTKRKRVISGGNHIKEENECIYISPRGVLKSCDIYSKELYDTNFSGYHNMQNIKDGNTIYVRSDNLKAFVEYFNKINNRIILVVGDSDYTFPKDLWDTNDSFIKFIENPNIIHIFAINVNTTHPKLTQYPIGLNYSILMEKGTEWGSKMSGEEQDLQLEEIHKKSLPFSERIIKCYSNFHFNMQLNRVYTQDRRDAKEQIPAECIYYEPKQILRKDTHINQTKYAFVVCPHGNGLDCYRQWEALVLGCIPVVKTSSIDILYDNLPVLIVKDWSDITMELLNSTIDKFKERKFNYDKLKLKYLMNSIKYINASH
jgi:hypothetical protein